MTTVSWPDDDYGPRSVTVLRLPAGCAGYVVVDDVVLGPAIGGLRMNSTVTPAEVARLARAMTLKSAVALLPHGGAKAGIRVPGALDADTRERVIRAFAVGIRGLEDYIPGPDMGTDETVMAWIHDEIGRSVGLPAALGGIPLDEIGATGYGLAACADALAEAGRLTLAGARVAIQGFGSVGRHAATFLADRGARIIAVSDTSAAVHDPDGLDVAGLLAFKASHHLADYADAKILDRDDLLTLDCDVLVPAAQPDVITEANADLVCAAVVLPGANIAVTAAAEAALQARGVLCLPDFVVNAGGVICAAVEYRGGGRTEAFAAIDERIRANTAELLNTADATGKPLRAAAEAMARARVERAAAYRRRF
ncbi:MAG: Glu/Leu/Phe/Val family dehydrogenase [Kineosporiaceae bacterium]